MNNEQAGEDKFEDIDECFRPVVRQYGRPMFALVMNVGLATQAAQVLGAQADKRQSRALSEAAMMMCQAFNTVSSALAALQGWTEEELTQCDRDVQLAFRNSVRPEGSSIIQLQ